MKVILLSLELCGGVDLGRADLLDGHLHVVHPLDHLGVPDVIIIIDMTVQCYDGAMSCQRTFAMPGEGP